MSTDAISAALQALGQALSLSATADGSLVKARLVPPLEGLNLADWAAGGLAEPLLAPFRIAGAAKNVGFPTGQIIEGDPTDPASTLNTLPLPDSADLTDTAVPLDSPLQAILGLLGGIEGFIPVGVTSAGHVPVTASICWRIRPTDGGIQPMAFGFGDRILDLDGPVVADEGTRQCTALTTESAVDLPIVPPIVPLTAPPQAAIANYELSANVVLRAAGVEHSVNLGPVTVPVPAVEVPTVLVVFSEFHYNTAKDGAKMVVLPGNVPVQQLQTLATILNDVSEALANVKGIARIAGLMAGIGSVVEALKPLPAGSKHKLIFVSFDEEDDLGDVAPDWRHRGFFDDHGAEDDIGSLLMLSVDRWVQLWEDQDFEDNRVDIRPSPTQFWIGIPDFRDMRAWIPPDASVVAEKQNFNDEAHSIRFRAN